MDRLIAPSSPLSPSINESRESALNPRLALPEAAVTPSLSTDLRTLGQLYSALLNAAIIHVLGRTRSHMRYVRDDQTPNER